MRRFLLLTIALLAGALLTACDDDGTGPDSIFGTYTLVTVNGEPLPYQEDGSEVTAGWVRLNSDNTYEISVTIGPIGGTPQTETGEGTYSIDGSSIELSDPEGGTENLTGTLSGNTLTIVDGDGNAWVLRK